jgi:hypothetical protein
VGKIDQDRVAQRQMPPWHIDRSVGIQKFKNDISLTDEQVDTIVAWVDQGALEGNPADAPTQANQRQVVLAGRARRLRTARSRGELARALMPAVSQDQWWRPTVDVPGLTEERWVRMVEIRPTNIQGRKIVHHSIAHIVMNEADPDSINKGIASPRRGPDVDDQDLVNARPTLMEWAIGKGYDRYPDGTGKLIKPGDKLSWDQHVHAIGEAVTAGSSLGIWLYPKARSRSTAFTSGLHGLKNGTVGLDIPPNTVAHTEGFTVLKENTVITNFQPHFHLRGRRCRLKRSCRRQHADRQLRRQVQLQLDDELHLRRRCGAGVPEGDDHSRHRVLRQHHGEQEQPGSEPVGRIRRPHRGRDGARLDEHLLPERRRVRRIPGRAQEAGHVDAKPAVSWLTHIGVDFETAGRQNAAPRLLV